MLLIVLNTPVMKVPNTSYFNIINLGIIINNQSVTLHGTDDVITNTMQRVQYEADIDNHEIKIKFIQEVNK